MPLNKAFDKNRVTIFSPPQIIVSSSPKSFNINKYSFKSNFNALNIKSAKKFSKFKKIKLFINRKKKQKNNSKFDNEIFDNEIFDNYDKKVPL